MNVYEGITKNLKHQQLINNLEQIIYGYQNGMNDDPENYLPLTKDQLIKYCYEEVFDIKDDGRGTTRMLKGICDDLKFLGNGLIQSEILRIGKEAEVLADEDIKDSETAEFDDSVFKNYYNKPALPTPGEAQLYGHDLSAVCDAIENYYGLHNKREALDFIYKHKLTKDEVDKAVNYVDRPVYENDEEIDLFKATPEEIDDYYSTQYYNKTQAETDPEKKFKNACYTAASQWMSGVTEETTKDFIKGMILPVAKNAYNSPNHSDEDYLNEIIFNLENERGIRFDFNK